MKYPVVLLAFLIAWPAALLGQEIDAEVRALGEAGPGGIFHIAESPDGRFLFYHTSAGPDNASESRMYDRSTARWFDFGAGEMEASWSPAGDRLAFAKLDEAEERMQVWTQAVDPGTGRPDGPPRRVSVREGRGPVFSPDGRDVVFTAIPQTDTVAPRIVAVPARGGPERMLLRAAGWTQQLRWTPDGEWLYFRYHAADRQGQPPLLARVPAGGGEPEILKPVVDFIGVSPDGQFLAYHPVGVEEARRTVVIATPEGDELGRFRLPRSIQPKNWGSTGWMLVAAEHDMPRGIHVVPVTGGSVRELTTGQDQDVAPAWSPDGERLAFVSQPAEGRQLRIAQGSGGPARTVGTREEPDRMHPAWAEDGRHLAFLSGGRSTINVVDLETGEEMNLSASGPILEWSWRADGRALRYVRSTEEQWEVREVTLSGVDRTLSPLGPELGEDITATFVGDTILVATEEELYAARLPDGRLNRLHAAATNEDPYYRLWPVTVSPDSRWVAVPVSVREERPRLVIRLLPLNGGTGRTVELEATGYRGVFQWHPDGRHLVLTANPDGSGRSEVYVIPLDGTPPRPVTTSDGSVEIWDSAVSPNGRDVAYIAVPEITGFLREIDLGAALLPFMDDPARERSQQ